jgi:hypothetical protein
MSNGTETVKFDNIPPEMKASSRRMMESRGLPPLPETGEWTKNQFLEFASKVVAAQSGSDGGSWNGMNNNWGNGGQGWPGGPGGPGGDPRRDEKKKEEDKSLVAVRYGKLPAGLPDWFTEDDSDKDGQIGLYEWRQAGKDLRDFAEMDLNNDDLISPQEYLRYVAQKAEQDRLASASEDGGSLGGGSSGGGSPGGGRPSFGSRGPGGGGPGFGGRGGGRGPGGGGGGSGPGGGGRGPGGGGR